MRDAVVDAVDQEVTVRVASEAEAIVKVVTVVVMIVVKARRVVLRATSTPPSVVALAVAVALLLHRHRWSSIPRRFMLRRTFSAFLTRTTSAPIRL